MGSSLSICLVTIFVVLPSNKTIGVIGQSEYSRIWYEYTLRSGRETGRDGATRAELRRDARRIRHMFFFLSAHTARRAFPPGDAHRVRR